LIAGSRTNEKNGLHNNSNSELMCSLSIRLKQWFSSTIFLLLNRFVNEAATVWKDAYLNRNHYCVMKEDKMLTLPRFNSLLKVTGMLWLIAISFLLPAQNDIKYEVSVDAMLVPLFAVDTNGNPVYNLRQEELILHINGKPVGISTFKRYEFEYGTTITKKISPKEIKPIVKPPERAIFIIIDSVFNSSDGLRRSKKIAVDLVNGAPEKDRFIIIENTPGGGLRHLAGPVDDRAYIVKKIKKIALQQSFWMKNLYTTNDLTNIEGSVHYRGMQTSRKSMDKVEYKNMIRRVSRVLSKLKYALKTITKPKIVFLISEGISRGAYEELVNPRNPRQGKYAKPWPFRYLMDIVKAVNEGGSVLYTINPQNINKSVDEGASGEMTLRYLADESGGKYFAGSDAGKIIKRIRKTTAAYYELAFLVPPQIGNQLELDITCKRKNVKVHTLSHSERNRPYDKMEPVQKKVFALNLVTGGSWSRMLAKVNRAKYKKSKKEKNLYTITVKLPEIMTNRDLDIFIIHIDPTAQSVDMAFNTGKASEKLELGVQRKKGRDLFFAVIDPAAPYCIYNKIR
jgi:VWFA-related protein